MSARLLKNPGKKHELADDLKAFVHILCWMCLCFYKHTLTSLHEQLSLLVVSVFEASDKVYGENEDVGGGIKHDMMLQGDVVVTLNASEMLLAALLRELAEICHDHYQATESKPAAEEEGQLKPLDATDYFTMWQALINRRTPQS